MTCPPGSQATSSADRPGNGWRIRNARGFSLLSTIHGIDNGSRTVFLTYMPFLLLGKGAGMDLMWLALGVTFAGGAAGKFVCGLLAERWGNIRTVLVTEAATGLGVLLLLALPVTPALFLLPILGIALNGTSSVLYGTVAELAAPERRSRVYGLFYTIGIGTGALAPPLFGLLSDAAGVTVTLAVLAAVILATLPLAHLLRPAVEGNPPPRFVTPCTFSPVSYTCLPRRWWRRAFPSSTRTFIPTSRAGQLPITRHPARRSWPCTSHRRGAGLRKVIRRTPPRYPLSPAGPSASRSAGSRAEPSDSTAVLPEWSCRRRDRIPHTP